MFGPHVIRDAHDPDITYQVDGPIYPMQVYNGLVGRKGNRQAPENDVDHTPREFRRVVNASGAQDIQIYNGLQRYTGFGFRIPMVDFLYGAVAIIPGQMRDDYAGKVKTGPGPLEYQTMVQNTAGAQPQNPGGVRQIAGNQLYNPGTS
jgi:hypothetical protein